MYTPKDFYSDKPPQRIIGTEMEYDFHNPKIKLLDIIDHVIDQTETAARPESYTGRYLRKSGGRVYWELKKLVEYATPESLGPRDAVISDLAGQEMVRRATLDTLAKIGEDPAHIKNGLFRRVGFYILNKSGGVQITGRDDYQATGYHESFYGPKWRDPMIAADFFGSFLATKPAWAGAGMFYDGQFLASQKGLSIGHNESAKTCNISARSLFRREDSYTPSEFQRIEVRGSDPLRSPSMQWLGLAATSLALRYIEYNAQDIHLFTLKNSVSVTERVTRRGNNAFVETRMGKRMHPREFQASIFEVVDRRFADIEIPDEERLALNALLHITNKKTDDVYMAWYPRQAMLSKKLSNDISTWETTAAIQYDLQFDNLLKSYNQLDQVLKQSRGIPNGITRQEVESRIDHAPHTRAKLRAVREEESHTWTSGEEFMDPYQTAA